MKPGTKHATVKTLLTLALLAGLYVLAPASLYEGLPPPFAALAPPEVKFVTAEVKWVAGLVVVLSFFGAFGTAPGGPLKFLAKLVSDDTDTDEDERDQPADPPLPPTRAPVTPAYVAEVYPPPTVTVLPPARPRKPRAHPGIPPPGDPRG